VKLRMMGALRAILLAAAMVAGLAQFGAAQAAVVPGTQLWATPYNGGTSDGFIATSVAASPNGKTVYVTGSNNQGSPVRFVTVAYDSATGQQQWATPYVVAVGGRPCKVAVSPDGKTVYVAGTTAGSTGDYVTIAFDAATGSQKWAKTYNGTANGSDVANSMAVNQATGNVYVTGQSGATIGSQYATVAYSPTGTPLWVNRFADAIGPDNGANAVAVNPNTGVVYVTGQSDFNGTVAFATEAISAAGVKQWVKHYTGPGTGADATAVTVSLATGDVFVTGVSISGATGRDYATVAYSSTGTPVWAKRYAGAGNDIAVAVAVNASGSAVYVTGRSLATNNQYDYVTVAYAALTGTKQWLRPYNGPGGTNADDEAVGVAVNQATGDVVVTGLSFNPTHGGDDYATINYSPAGTRLWISRFTNPIAINNKAYALAVNPVSGAVYVTGSSGNSAGEYGYYTVAYAP
jgi:outer membrane protein assembly factor BamB